MWHNTIGPYYTLRKQFLGCREIVLKTLMFVITVTYLSLNYMICYQMKGPGKLGL